MSFRVNNTKKIRSRRTVEQELSVPKTIKETVVEIHVNEEGEESEVEKEITKIVHSKEKKELPVYFKNLGGRMAKTKSGELDMF